MIFGLGKISVFAETSPITSYVPLIGISSVPEPLSLPKGPGNITYNYAVKNFLREVALTNIQVVDDKCSPVKYVEGDDNKDSKLDYSETWRFACTTKISVTTESVATATGTVNNLTALHKSYVTVVVGSDNLAPLVNIINVTKVAYPLKLPIGGGDITFTYRVNNPGLVPLSNVSVVDDKCKAMSNKLGDINNNNLLDINEVWVYTCTTHLNQTTTNTVSVHANANGLNAVGYATLTITVDIPKVDNTAVKSSPNFPNTGTGIGVNFKIITWIILLGILVVLIIFFKLTKINKEKKILKLIVIIIIIFGIIGVGYYFLFANKDKTGNTVIDTAFGWKFPTVKFPLVGPGGQLAYSSIRDPGGIPSGLPVRLQVPIIGVDSAIEDALITPDGKMDVPAGSVDVAWFSLGPKPGEVGSAVVGGHFGISNGIPFVFYKLDELKVGDKVYILNDKGDTLAFQVRSIKLFDRNADATTVFTSSDGLSHLNLITCEGIWNQVNGSYPQRRVVFTDAIQPEGAVIKEPVGVNFYRTLKVGLKGADVVSLQTIVGALPADGVFGPMTKTKVKIWQTNNGLVADGTFGPVSKAKFILEKSRIAAIVPTFPLAGITVLPSTNIEPTLVPMTFARYIKSLYETPIDGLITSIIIIGILFMLFKIIKR